MIEIITSSGVSLDLSPDAEFEVDFESPIFADDRMPVAFSTQIAFPPTRTNMLVFGFLPGSLNLPANKNINVTIFASGIPLFVGKIVFDGFEDDMMQYTFSGTDLAGSFENMDIADFAPAKSITAAELTSIKNGEYLFVKAPLIVDKEYVAAPIYNTVGDTVEGCGAKTKYANLHADSDVSRFIPAFQLYQFVYGIFSRNGLVVKIDSSLSEILTATHILGQYRPEVSDGDSGMLTGDESAYMLGQTLPDMNVSDFLMNVLNMFCLGVFRDGAAYAIKSFSEILQSNTIIDIDSVIGDVQTMSREDVTSYRFGFSNDDENTYSGEQLDNDIAAGTVSVAESLLFYHDYAAEYSPFYHEKAGGVYSGKKIACWTRVNREGTVETEYFDLYLTDVLFLPHLPVEYPAENSDTETDASTEFNLVRCIPEKVYTLSRNTKVNRTSVAPVMERQEAGCARGNDAYVGLIVKNQMCDSGVVVNHDDFTDYDSGLSLCPQDLFDTWHASFAGWLAKDRLCVTAELNLPLPELANLRLYNKVFFRGRVWLIKKLSLRLSVKTDTVEAEGEFVTV